MSNSGMRIRKYDKYHERLRKELRAIRVGADLTQEQLAEQLGTKQAFISKYERGERNLDFIEVLQVCSACGYDPVKLITKMKVDHK
jgi:transcriptional regulator with XRE-family HTH domain